ncbi:hypothetical protein DWY99_04285 [[Clostridium] leptum]|uniref:Uncharacterized protein n=1 Tax=[Clostridium] leptum TaxID=1535 RepID=A0A412AYQ3_9FIRM|nr:hypothetical protein DWY99_04285 [[Clostridium] leptum]
MKNISNLPKYLSFAKHYKDIPLFLKPRYKCIKFLYSSTFFFFKSRFFPFCLCSCLPSFPFSAFSNPGSQSCTAIFPALRKERLSFLRGVLSFDMGI